MKTDKIIMYGIEIILIISSICFMLFVEEINKITMAVILLIIMVISQKFIKSDKAKGKYDRRITKLMIFIALFYLSAIYVLGIYVGFYTATIRFSKWGIINYIIPYILLIIATENIRKTILLKEQKKSNYIMIIICVILDIALTTNIYSVITLLDYFVLIGFVIFSAVANNLLYNYIIINFRNSRAIIAYRIITTIYVYIIPIIPNIHILFESIIRMIVPTIIYIVLSVMYAKTKKEIIIKKKSGEVMITSLFIVFAIGVIMLVSCKFKYGALVIGSGSMTGTINKGDVIIYETLDESIEVGDIIVFYQDDVRIIHRVINKQDSGAGMKYYTKGDANQNEDEGYVEESDIVGKVKLRLPYLGQLTVLLNSLFD